LSVLFRYRDIGKEGKTVAFQYSFSNIDTVATKNMPWQEVGSAKPGSVGLDCRRFHRGDVPGRASGIKLIASSSRPSTADFRFQKIQRVARNSRIAATVKPWYTRSSVCRELLCSPGGVAMEMNAVGEDVCIGGLPFNALRQGLRNLDLAGSHSCILRHRIFPEVAEQCEKRKKYLMLICTSVKNGGSICLKRAGGIPSVTCAKFISCAWRRNSSLP